MVKVLETKPGGSDSSPTDESLCSWLEPPEMTAALDEHTIVAITDPRGTITFVNDTFCTISKYTREDLLGQNHRIINSSHHSREFLRALWRTISSGGTWRGEIKTRANDGSFFWVAATIIPLLDDQGHPRRFVAIATDITERKRVEGELAEKLRLQKLLAELSTRFVALPSGNIDVAIEEAQRLVVETLDLDRTTLWQIVEPELGLILTHSWQRPGCPPLPTQFPAERFLPWMHSRIIAGEIVCFTTRDELPPEAAHDFEAFRRHPPKSTVGIPLIANGQVFGAVAFATLRREHQWREGEIADLKLVAQIIGNVVIRHRADLREEQLRGELAHAMRVATLGELAAVLAHELTQPLAAILSNAQAARRFVLDGGIEPDELQAILADIIRDDKRAGSIIHNLRAMVRKRPSVREACSLNELVQEVRELMHAELISEKIDLRPALADGLPSVHGARVELQQVLVNLLVNAVHAMASVPPERRIIDLATHTHAGHVVVTFSDRGHGIPSDRLSSIFDPFYSSRPDGLGMGLSICRRIIENHGGQMTASNHEKGGASFQFSLPAMAAQDKT